MVHYGSFLISYVCDAHPSGTLPLPNQFLNRPSILFSYPDGRVSVVSDVHSLKQYLPILLTLVGMLTDLNEESDRNTYNQSY